MSYVRAKQSFKDAQRSIKSSHDIAQLAMVDGLLQLTASLEKHLTELHSEIVFIRNQLGSKGARKPRAKSKKR